MPKGFLEASRVEEDWRCPVCGVSATMLFRFDKYFPEKVRCSRCGFPFSLSYSTTPKEEKLRPTPALGTAWQHFWVIAHKSLRNPVRVQEIAKKADSPLYALRLLKEQCEKLGVKLKVANNA